MIDYSKYKIIIENPKSSYKSFETDNDAVWNSYPLKGVTYPVDYGCIDGYKGEDEAELDIFVGSGNKNGCIKVWRLDVPEETKFFIKLTDEELANVLKVFEPVLLKHEILDDENFVSKIEKFKIS
jgi:hypothetical protein